MPGKRVEHLALKGMMGRDSLGIEEGSVPSQTKSRKPKSLKVPMTANDGDNATRPKGSAWPGLHTVDAGICRRSPQGCDPPVIHGDRGHRAVEQMLRLIEKGQKVGRVLAL